MKNDFLRFFRAPSSCSQPSLTFVLINIKGLKFLIYMQVRFLKNFIGTTNSQRPLFTVRPEKVTFIESGNLSNNILYVYMQIEP